MQIAHGAVGVYGGEGKVAWADESMAVEGECWRACAPTLAVVSVKLLRVVLFPGRVSTPPVVVHRTAVRGQGIPELGLPTRPMRGSRGMVEGVKGKLVR